MFFSWFRISPVGPARTILVTSFMLHWAEPRALTIPECRRLMSFPDAFRIPEGLSFRAAWKLLGNAVPPLMMRAVALAAKKSLGPQKRPSRKKKKAGRRKRGARAANSSGRIDEAGMLRMIDGAKNVLLIEPPYKRKYPSLALAKIAARLKTYGAAFRYRRGVDGEPFDLACVTSLFTTDGAKTLGAVRAAEEAGGGAPVLLGGVMASLMPERFERNTGARIFVGPSEALDAEVPDLDAVSEGVEDPWDTFSYLQTSRGCPNKCDYCAVWRMEPKLWVNPRWKLQVIDDRPNICVCDSNLTGSRRGQFEEVVAFLAHSGKGVLFEEGLDCKFITEARAEVLAKLKFVRHGMRLAFDRIEEDGTFQRALGRLADAGVPKSQTMAYVLFNFNDSPQEADYRMRECVRLGIRPYPQQYQPLNKTSRKPAYVGPKWTRTLMQAFRFFWLMAGSYTKMKFEEYFTTNAEKYKATDADWAAWNVPFRPKKGARRRRTSS